MPLAADALDLHSRRPSVYLDQWVWIRLAKADRGKPREASDPAVLAAVRDASAAGVVFPLSATHYMETSKVTSPRQRSDLARTMASISRCRTLRSRRVLLRHQMLHAMHVSFGRPAFRPQPPEVLSAGLMWAFTGEPAPLTLHGPDGPVDPSAIPGMREFLRKANQFGEMRMLAGPADHEVEDLRRRGYRPEETTAVVSSRVDWETTYVGLLADDPVSRAELRVRVQAREILHEHLDLLNELLAEYRLNLGREIGAGQAGSKSSRRRMIAFADLMPSVRIAVDLKVELFRNAAKTWTMNAIHDIDALSMAVPYCHAVVPDSKMANLLSRSQAGQRNGTLIVKSLTELPDLLPGLADQARSAGDDTARWDWAASGGQYCLDEEDLLSDLPSRPPAA
jgi:hypothetical protein